MKKSKFPYIVLIPTLVILFIFVLLPICGSFIISFMDYNPLRASSENVFVGLDNFKRLFTDELFHIALKNTLVYVVMFVVINIIFTLTVAQLLASLKSRFCRSAFRVSFFMPCVAPLAAVSVVWKFSILQGKGLLNMVLGTDINWIDPAHLMPILIVISLWADVGYNIILFIAGIEGIPTSYFEAAEIDGAGPLRRFFNITFPLLNRTFVYVLITTIISQFQAFAQFSILSKGSNYGLVLAPFIYSKGFGDKQMGYACAVSLVLFVIIMVITLIERRVTRADWGYE